MSILILHEGGHYLFGKLTGYQLLSFQVKKFVYSEKNKKITYIQSGPTVIAGQCLMSPPPKGSYAEKPFKLYLLGGVMVNGLTGHCPLRLLLPFGAGTGHHPGALQPGSPMDGFVEQLALWSK